ncbi:unnamed protein product [Cochlearia groenlandica]
MYPPPPSSSAQDSGDAGNNEYNNSAAARTTHDFSFLGSQTHNNPPPPYQPPWPQQQHNSNVTGDYLSGETSSSLFRHRSSPAGFFEQLLPTNLNAARNGAVSTSVSFGNENINKWDNTSSHINFTIYEPGKRSKTTDFFTLESQYSMPQTSHEMARMESLMNIPEDSVPCKVRAKRGCATHPRSIAERERRTRISGKLKKLQELVPNMDKQTSYADMLDLAVEHIKGLQHQVESLEKGMERCTCKKR